LDAYARAGGYISSTSTPQQRPKTLLDVPPGERRLARIAEKEEHEVTNPYQDGNFIMAPGVLNMLSA
jgi:hypothetical protein